LFCAFFFKCLKINLNRLMNKTIYALCQFTIGISQRG
jgi:hypothetical protein